MNASGTRTIRNDDSLLVSLSRLSNSNIIPFRATLIDGKLADTNVNDPQSNPDANSAPISVMLKLILDNDP